MRVSAAGLCIAVGLASVLGGSPQARADGNQPEVYFSPHGGCTEAVVREIGAARSTVYVQAYSFTSAPIAQALADAEARGVHVEVILDKSNRSARYSGAEYLIHHGIPTRTDAAHAIAHNKVMIIDGQVVLTGSFNFTKAAEEHNAENLLVLRDSALAAEYLRNWKIHALHSPFYEQDQSPAEARSHRNKQGKEGPFSALYVR